MRSILFAHKPTRWCLFLLRQTLWPYISYYKSWQFASSSHWPSKSCKTFCFPSSPLPLKQKNPFNNGDFFSPFQQNTHHTARTETLTFIPFFYVLEIQTRTVQNKIRKKKTAFVIPVWRRQYSQGKNSRSSWSKRSISILQQTFCNILPINLGRTFCHVNFMKEDWIRLRP